MSKPKKRKRKSLNPSQQDILECMWHASYKRENGKVKQVRWEK